MSWAYVLPIMLLLCSNVFMTFAWYGQLRFPGVALWIVIPVSWGIAFFEYCLAVPANRIGYTAEHLSVYQTSPELWEREAFEEQLDGAPEATGEPGKSSAGELGRLVVRMFFSAGAGLLAWSHMPVETAQ